jgi:hypothetical protein
MRSGPDRGEDGQLPGKGKCAPPTHHWLEDTRFKALRRLATAAASSLSAAIVTDGRRSCTVWQLVVIHHEYHIDDI